MGSAHTNIVEAGVLRTAEGRVEYIVEGAGTPVTVVAHGLTKSIADTRPFVHATPGTVVYFHFRGHGNSPVPPVAWTYDGLADELLTVADHFRATQVVVVSMAAAVLSRVLEARPDRFARMVFLLPVPLFGVADGRPGVLSPILDDVVAGDVASIARFLAKQQPPWMTLADPHGLIPHAMAEHLVRQPETVRALANLERADPIVARTALARVTASALVIGQGDDPVHPAEDAEQLAAALPDAEVRMLGEFRSFSAYSRSIRQQVAAFLEPCVER